MENCHELMRLAANAVGYRICHFESDTRAYVSDDLRDLRFYWAPADDDGDAFRLLVALGIDSVMAGVNFWDKASPDRLTGMRLAVLRAAAVIGRGMPLADRSNRLHAQSVN